MRHDELDQSLPVFTELTLKWLFLEMDDFDVLVEDVFGFRFVITFVPGILILAAKGLVISMHT